MKKTLFLASLVLASPAFPAPSGIINESSYIIPRPVEIKEKLGASGFSVADGIKIGKEGIYDMARTVLSTVSVKTTESAQPDIVFTTDKDMPVEAYKLTVAPDKITIVSSTDRGAFYAMQSLVQGIVADADGKAAIPAMEVTDQPRFGWRGIMMDSVRHMMPVKDIKKVIDLLARYKFNTMHWHLTDDQGWRIEIKKYPKLTEIGSIRHQSPVVGNRNARDGKPYGGYYTQEQIKDVVAYAKARGITIVPEIETPGHACAAIKAYPEFGNKDIPNYDPIVSDSWGVLPYTFSPSPETFAFLDDVFAEVAALFPDSPYIHIGGDEAPKTQWEQSAYARKVMADNNLKNAHELQSYFVKNVEKIVNKHGKKIIGWDEINEGGLSKTATMMVWRDWKWADFAINNGNDVVITTNSHLYFDYGQPGFPKTPEYDYIGSNIPWEKVYSLDPVPQGITGDKLKHVLGVQANVWCEYIPNLPKWQYHVFPRAIALSEVAWTPLDRKDQNDFVNRLQKHLPFLDALKVNYWTMPTGAPAQPDAVITRELDLTEE